MLFFKQNTNTNESITTISAKKKEGSNLPVSFELRVIQIKLFVLLGQLFKYISQFFHKGSDHFGIRYLFGPGGQLLIAIDLF